MRALIGLPVVLALACVAVGKATAAPRPGEKIGESDGCITYLGYGAALPESGSYKRCQLTPTKMAGLTSAVTVQAALASDSDTERSRSGPKKVVTHTELVTKYGTRVSLKLRRPELVMTNLTVLAQYFGRKLSSGSTKGESSQFAVHAFRVASLDGSGVTVELPVVELKKAETKVDHPYWKSNDESGSEFQGMVITVFDSASNGVCQVVSTSSLASRGDAAATAKAKAAKAKALLDAQDGLATNLAEKEKNPKDPWAGLKILGAQNLLNESKKALESP
jgi:hypothetical protein